MSRSGRLSQLGKAVRWSDLILLVLKKVSRETDCEYWIGAGAVAQTVWNHATRRPPEYGINDIDVAYYDVGELSESQEKKREKKLTEMLCGLGIPLDVKNQARVHIWYAGKFGYEISPYTSLQDAVGTWPTTATAIAIRMDASTGVIETISPFGLGDLLSLRVGPNKRQITEEIYEKYCIRWQSKWPELDIEEWES